MEKQLWDSWPHFEVAAKEEEPAFWFQDQLPPLDFNGSSHLSWESEVPMKDGAFGADPLVDSFALEPLLPSMDLLPDHNSMLQDDWYNSYDGGFGLLNDLCVQTQPNKGMKYCNGEIEKQPKERKVERCRGQVALFSNEKEIIEKEERKGKRCRKEERMEFCNGENTGEEMEGKVERYREEKIPSFNELSQYFYMPITQAAKEMNVGLTLLKKRCRELGIPRWPHRKMKSLQTLIKNVQELGKEDGELGEVRLRAAVEVLEHQRRLMEKIPAMEIGEKTKKLRQACFKANYKKKKLMGMDLQPSSYVWLQNCENGTAYDP